MAYVKITCKKCHHQYLTDKSLSRCPECNQLNSKDEGKTYRAFLEGRIKEKSYILLLHLTNLELKAVE